MGNNSSANTKENWGRVERAECLRCCAIMSNVVRWYSVLAKEKLGGDLGDQWVLRTRRRATPIMITLVVQIGTLHWRKKVRVNKISGVRGEVIGWYLHW
jgi:hypothetical protein